MRTMMSVFFPVDTVAAMIVASVFSACAAPETRTTQAVVVVTADARVAPRLQNLKVLLYPSYAVDPQSPSRVQQFPLVAGSSSGTAFRLPFSFGIAKGNADELTVVVKGCADGEECADVLVEQKVRLRFQAGHTVQVSVLLTQACVGASLRCVGLQQTCAATTTETSQAGMCVALLDAPATIIQPGAEKPPTLPADLPERSVDATTELGPDASSPTEQTEDAGPAVHDGGLDDGAADAARTCPPENTCAEAYPCLPDEGQGYVCRGQFADWPMPDALPGARTAPRYDASSDEIVRDEVTGLLWQRRLPNVYAGCSGQKNQAGDSCTWEEAGKYCAELQLANLAWRLPTKIELESLFDYRVDVATLDDVLFFVSSSDFHWTASTSAVPDSQDQAFAGTFQLAQTTTLNKSEPHPVRCVHSNEQPLRAEPSRYVHRVTENLIGDARTGLIWSAQQLCALDFSYEQAEELCAELPGGLRVPSVKELLTLVDPMRAGPAIDVATFEGTPRTPTFWSSTPAKWTPDRMVVNFSAGYPLTDGQMRILIGDDPEHPERYPYCIRCVK